MIIAERGRTGVEGQRKGVGLLYDVVDDGARPLTLNALRDAGNRRQNCIIVLLSNKVSEWHHIGSMWKTSKAEKKADDGSNEPFELVGIGRELCRRFELL